MGVFLGLGHVKLPDAVLREQLGQRLVDVLLLEGDRAGEVLVIARHGGEIEAAVEELDRQLAGSVRPEVEEDRRVSVT